MIATTEKRKKNRKRKLEIHVKLAKLYNKLSFASPRARVLHINY